MEDLVEKAKQGDKNAFTSLVLRNQSKLYQIATIRLHNEADIDDAIQETMIIAYQKLKKLKENTKFNSWLMKILINQCNEIYRKNKSNVVSLEIVKNHLEDKRNKDIDAKLEYETILEQLPYEEKLLIILYYSNGYTTKQISQILHKNENTIKTKLRRTKQKIKEYIERGQAK